MGMLTATDIARLAKVSRSTISRVVNDYPNVPAETRKRVMEIIRQTGYVPHQQARHLAGVRSKTLVLYVDNCSDYYADKIAGSSFFGPITAYLIDSANRRGYDAIVTQSAAPHSWSRARDLLYGRLALGIIFLGVPNKDPRVQDFQKVPTVIIDHKPVDDISWKGFGTVNFDNLGGMKSVVEYLNKKNRKKIAYITGNLKIYSGIQRFQGFKKAMVDFNLPLYEELIVQGDFSEESGYQGTKLLLKSKFRPDAIVASDDECGIGVLHALDDNSIAVPDEISVVGFDDIELSRYIRPALTTVSAPKKEAADRAIDLLIQSIEGNAPINNHIIIPTKFIERVS